jgi:hypothetical protein
LAAIQRSARTLALTEWKLVRSETDLVTKAEEARNQAGLYSSGPLRSLELKRTRYVVLVCEQEAHPPEDVSVSGITYRHVVVPVRPAVPSKSARSM